MASIDRTYVNEPLGMTWQTARIRTLKKEGMDGEAASLQAADEGRRENARRFNEITLQKPTSTSLVADAFKQLQDAESTTHEAHCGMMDATEPGIATLDYNRAVDAYRQAYLAECEVSTKLGEKAAILEGNDAAVAERIGAAYCMSGSARMEPVMFSALYSYLQGYCRKAPIPEDFLEGGYVTEFCKLLCEYIDQGYALVDAEALHRSASVIVLDLDIWGIPK